MSGFVSNLARPLARNLAQPLTGAVGAGVDDLLIDDIASDHLLIDDSNTDVRKIED